MFVCSRIRFIKITCQPGIEDSVVFVGQNINIVNLTYFIYCQCAKILLGIATPRKFTVAFLNRSGGARNDTGWLGVFPGTPEGHRDDVAAWASGRETLELCRGAKRFFCNKIYSVY